MGSVERVEGKAEGETQDLEVASIGILIECQETLARSARQRFSRSRNNMR